MPTKQFYATGDFRYGTRMLRAGDPVRLDGPNARLFAALGKITDKKPRVARVVDQAVETVVEAPAPRRRKLTAKT